MKTHKLLLMIGCALSLQLGCASQQAVTEQEKAPATQYEQGLTEDPSVPSQYTPCGQTASSSNSKFINANKLYVNNDNGQRLSLCQALTQSGKSVAIFQFSGLLCLSCQQEAQYVNRQNLNSVEHFLIFTDDESDIDPYDVNNFRQMAPRSKFLWDSPKVVANDLNRGKAFGTVLVLHRSGKYKLYLSPGLEHQWFPEAQRMAQDNSTGSFNNQNQFQNQNQSQFQNQNQFNQQYNQQFNQPYNQQQQYQNGTPGMNPNYGYPLHRSLKDPYSNSFGVM